MNLAATAGAALAQGRLAIESLMRDTCVVVRRTGSTTDPDTGQTTDTWSTVYSGKCRVQQNDTIGQRVDAGESPVTLLRMVLQLPVVGSELIAKGDRVSITAAADDAALVGRVFRVHDLAHKSQATARRLGIEEAT